MSKNIKSGISFFFAENILIVLFHSIETFDMQAGQRRAV